MNYAEIIEALREFTARDRVDFPPGAPESLALPPYEPIAKYVLDLRHGAKPESAAEDLFTALCQDVLGFQPTRQVGVAEGFVDFMLPERMGEPMQLELKPLFLRDGPEALRRSDANPKNHAAQVRKYLRDHEYLTLTDLRTAWFFSARDFYFESKPFAQLPFAEFLNYRRIDEDIFGKSYEMFLASNRKDEGIYYTPAGITGPMADSLVRSLAGKTVDEICAAVGSQQCDFQRADQLMAQLAEIRVADTACGSGGFLIKVLRAFWQQYQRIDSACAWVAKILKPDNGELYLAELPPNVENALAFRRRHQLDNHRVLIAQILLRHIFGVDKDPGALEVAKTNIWKEAVKLSPAHYNYRELKTDVVKILPNLELNFHAADSLVDVALEKQAGWLAEYHQAELKKLSDLRVRYIGNPMDHAPLDEALTLRMKVRADLVEHFQDEGLPCEPAGFVLHFWPCWFKPDGTPKPFCSSRRKENQSPKKGRHEVNERGGDGSSPVAVESSALVTGTSRPRPVRWQAQTSSPPKPSDIKDQTLLPSSPAGEMAAGFDGIVGNPPWEGFKPIRKEFAAHFYRGKPQFSKLGMDGPTFEKWFGDELKESKEFAARWREHEAYYERHKEHFGKNFTKQGTGDWNLFKLFIERDLSLVRQGGQFSLLVPSGFQTDEGCADLRRWVTTEHRLDELTSFENRGYRVVEDGREKTKQISPDVDSRFKFGFFKVIKGVPTPQNHAFDARFYLHDPKDAFAPPIRYSIEMLQRFSPTNESFMEFRSATDYALATKIRGKHNLLDEFGYTFRRELHMTGDNHFFRELGDKKPAKEQLRLYEGKMIHQFDAGFSPPTFAVEEIEVREELLRKDVFRIAQILRDNNLKRLEGRALPASRQELETMLRQVFETRGFKLQYEFERFVYREVASSTNERTIIATVIPERVCVAHTLMYLNPYDYVVNDKGELMQHEVESASLRELLGLVNSLTLNFYLRNKVTTHVSVFQFVELPIPGLKPAARKRLASVVDKLLKDPRDVQERAALEVFIARELYGLSLDDWKHLTGTFTFGSGETKAELDEIIRQSLVLWQGSATCA